MVLILLSSGAYFQGVPVAAATAPDIVAPTVTGAINVQNPGSEAFWNQLTPIVVPLTATDNYGGGVASVSIKIATNGTHILMSATWSDPVPAVNRLGTAPATPAAYPGLTFANATTHQFDQFAVWWSLQQTPGPPPCMDIGTNMHGGTSQAAIAGTGNVWRWTSSSTDSGGASWPTAKYGAGTPLATHLINYTHSFATDNFINQTGFYVLGYGSSSINSTVGTNSAKVPYQNQIVYAKGVYSNATKTWDIIAARPLVTSPSTDIAQFSYGQTYDFAVAAFMGGAHPIPAGVPAPAGWTEMADSGMTKSISTWVTLQLSPNAPGASTTTSSATPSTVTSTATVTNTATTTSVSTATTTATVTNTATTTSVSTATTTAVSTTVATTTVTNSVISTAAYIGAIAALLVGLTAGIIVTYGRSRRNA
jgi:hypothetical protein